MNFFWSSGVKTNSAEWISVEIDWILCEKPQFSAYDPHYVQRKHNSSEKTYNLLHAIYWLTSSRWPSFSSELGCLAHLNILPISSSDIYQSFKLEKSRVNSGEKSIVSVVLEIQTECNSTTLPSQLCNIWCIALNSIIKYIK